MPTTEIGTLDENGNTNLGSYSLCFPYYIAGRDYHAMILCCRNSSNTAKNILKQIGINEELQTWDSLKQYDKLENVKVIEKGEPLFMRKDKEEEVEYLRS